MLSSTHDATENEQNLNNSTRMNLPLFILSFIFLAVVISFNTFQQWQVDERHFDEDVHRTLDNYAMQAGLLARAALHANNTLALSYNDLLEQCIKSPETVDKNGLWGHISAAIFNATGFFLFSTSGDLLYQYGQLTDANEIQDINNNLDRADYKSTVFSLRYGHMGGYYIATPFKTASSEYILISRRSYSNLSDMIHNGHFPGFEMLLIEQDSNKVSIREKYFASTDNQPLLTTNEQAKIIYSTPIPRTGWSVAALPVQGYKTQQLRERLRNPSIFLVVFGLILIGLWHFLRHQERQVEHLRAQRHHIERRADKALKSIDEALISTDVFGTINYVNPKAVDMLGYQNREDIIGRQLSELWSDQQALWNRGLDIEELNTLQDSGRQLNLIHKGEARILEQSYHSLYENNKITGIVWLLRDVTEAVKAKNALEESRTRYKALFEEAGIAHCLLGLRNFPHDVTDIDLIDVNEAALQLADASDRFELEQYYANHTEDFKPLVAALLHARDLKLTNTEFEMTLHTISGELRHIWANLSLRPGADGQALMTLLDMTERKNATEQIRERESFWAHVMDSMPDLVYVVDLDDTMRQHIAFKNRAISEILGYPDTPEFTERNWMSFADPEEVPQLHKALMHIHRMQPNTTREGTARFQHADGSIRILKFRDSPFETNKSGEVVRYVGTIRDVTDDVEKQEQIIESERRYRLLAENMKDIVWATDAELNFNFVSTSVTRLLGYQPDELLREGVSAIFSKRDIRTLFKTMRHHVLLAIRHPVETRRHNAMIRQDMVATSKTGGEIKLELQASLLWNDNGELQGMLGVCRDVTESRQIEQELQLAAEVFENSNEAILITDHQLRIAKTNKSFTHITGYSQQAVIGQTPDFLISLERHHPDFFEQIGESLVVDGYWQGEIFYKRMNNDIRTGWAGVSAIRDHNHEMQSLIIIMSDITERKVIEERIHRLAYFDPLTGLPNRSQMHERLESMLASAQKNEGSVALLFIDLDRFKPINDSMGHPAGDQVLKQVALRLNNCVKKQDIVCRMGGDEFTIAVGEQTNNEAAADTAVRIGERILRALNRPFLLGQREVFISASVGIGIYPNDGSSVIELLKNADMAMYHAKDMGRNNVQFFNASMNKKAVQLLELENDLRHALSRQELELYFQPQYNAASASPVGVEALLRWHHPSKGMIAPGVFIPIIEDTGLIVPIGQWVLEQACLQFAEWKEKYNIALEHIAVNVSARQFKQNNFLELVKDAIFKSGLHPYQLELELTESILMDDIAHTLETLNGLRRLGVKTAIDDFGTGYSSLNYLKQFPVDTLKIDRSFIQNLPANMDDAQITLTIIAMGHNLGMGIIAEGVETTEQLEFLVKAKCEAIQGFLFSKPIPERELLEMFKIERGQSTT